MESKPIFEGQVRVQTLTRTENPRTRDDFQARILSPNGELAVLSPENATIRHLGYLQLKPGLVRGNHFHKLRHESFYMISGEVEMQLEELSSGKKETIIIREGDMVLIDPGIAHAFLPLSEGQAVEFAPEPFDQADIYRHVISEPDKLH